MNNEQGRVLERKLELVHRRTHVEEVTPAKVLRELLQLLEDYAPTWYTQEAHDRAVAALATGSFASERRPTSA